ncbi:MULTISPECIES: ATP-binding protein [Actinoplanes]|uniref:ATP-binding protein n=1 Tax=Actinoplanes TaxID=1865 RepID=UPI0005F2D1F9|nr:MULTISPECIES: ATP-binding protein [Actinoplanes]GLY07663.1 hypothetical protein Acsp01_80420 [Actinoplanes sp. NBRC 101535]
MHEPGLYPDYVPRPAEEKQIQTELARVREDGESRAVLLYGPGGVGKTQMLRALGARGRDGVAVWLAPIDMDDSEYWLLSNLERRTVEQLDPDGGHFAEYLRYLSELPRLEHDDIAYETVVSHLARIKRVFVECYTSFVRATGTVVVIPLDTVEAIRGMDLLVTVTQWMKSLPNTLFLLSGRPPHGGEEALDAIAEQLSDPHQHIPVTSLRLGPFGMVESLAYLETSAIAGALTAEEKSKFAHLAQGHPLWLAITLDYLQDRGMPEEAAASLAEIAADLPLPGEPTPAGRLLHEAFKRRLVTPYRDSDFWHEATKRLAVIRKNVSLPIWLELMADRPMPAELASWQDAWFLLLDIPWIRPRANRHYVTLHDAFADELAQRIIPVHDSDQRWRRDLWERAVRIYGVRADEQARVYRERRASLNDRLRAKVEDDTSAAPDATFILEVEHLSQDKRELDQLRTAHLYYQVLLDPEPGCREFLQSVEQARRDNDVLFQSLVTMEMQRFLPGADRTPAVTEAVAEAVDSFHRWLIGTSPSVYVDIGIAIAAYLVTTESWQPAAVVLEGLPVRHSPPLSRYQVHILRGNVYMRLPGRVAEGLTEFELSLAETDFLPEEDRPKRRAEAEKELGFYYRNVGRWDRADAAYGRAHQLIWEKVRKRSPAEDQGEMASIRINWAYVKGLSGSRHEGHQLVESAIKIRQRFQQRSGEGIGWSVHGELHRFDGEFDQAWRCYRTAERLFHSLRSWHWLGQIYQQQAVCLHQAMRRGVEVEGVPHPAEQAKKRIGLALDICRDQAIRSYPSALNRAGRIYGSTDRDRGLRYLHEGITQARALSDGWFLFANMVEYAELSYEAWQLTGRDHYRAQTGVHADEIAQVSADYTFPSLAGRWRLVQGHVLVRQSLEAGDPDRLPDALLHYTEGFQRIAEGYQRSHGVTAIPDQFAKFRELFVRLPENVQEQWEESLRQSWGGSVELLARLEELY